MLGTSALESHTRMSTVSEGAVSVGQAQSCAMKHARTARFGWRQTMRMRRRLMCVGVALLFVAALTLSATSPAAHAASRRTAPGPKRPSIVAPAAPLAPVGGPITTTDQTQGVTPLQMAQAIVGTGITISNVTYTGAGVAGGTFAGGSAIFGFDSGIILSSGCISNVIGPNTLTNATCVNNTPGDAQLTSLSGFPTFDAAVLQFDFVPQGSQVSFQYVFGSEEYNEFVNTQFNDVFAFYVNGNNCAVVGTPPVPVTINTINNGNPFGSTPNSHPELYVNNDFQDGTAPFNTQLDGFTKVLTCSASVNAGVTNHIKLAIADSSDAILDSDVFIKAGSFTIDQTPPTCSLLTSGTNAQGQKFITIATQDSDGGLAGPQASPAGIVVTSSSNATVSIPTYTAGTTTEVDVTATKIDQSLGSSVGLQITDVAGNSVTCDPAILNLSRDPGKPATTTVNGIAKSEHYVHVNNGTPGVANLTISVNGKTFKVHGLTAGQKTTIDISSALVAGANSVILTATGSPGGSMIAVIADS